MPNEHYDAGGIATIDFIKAKLTNSQYEGYLIGNIIKYASRINYKGQADKDIRKLAEYSKWLEEFHDNLQS